MGDKTGDFPITNSSDDYDPFGDEENKHEEVENGVKEIPVAEEDAETKVTLTTWMVKNADILPSHAANYAAVFIANGMGSFKRIAKKIVRDPDYMIKIGITIDDAEEIASALKNEGMIDAVPQEYLPSLPLTLEALQSLKLDMQPSLDSFETTPSAPSSPGSPVRYAKRQSGGNFEVEARVAVPKKGRRQEDIEHCEKEKKDIGILLDSIRAFVEKPNEPGVEITIVFALKDLIKLAEGSRRRQKYLGRLGACQLMPLILRKFGKNRGICEITLEAISVLCRHGEERNTQNLDNIKLLGDAGACKGRKQFDILILALTCYENTANIFSQSSAYPYPNTNCGDRYR